MKNRRQEVSVMHTMLVMVGAGLLLGCWLVWQAIIVLAEVIQSLLRLLAFLLPIAVVVLLASVLT
jgi:phosphate/sulfate permease